MFAFSKQLNNSADGIDPELDGSLATHSRCKSTKLFAAIF
jgi:hypothetical protein